MNTKRLIQGILIVGTCALVSCMGYDSHGRKGSAADDNSKKTITLTQEQRAKIEIRQGETFTLNLNGNPTTGFLWKYCGKETIDGVVLEEEKYKEKQTKEPICGAPGVFTFTFRAVKEGTYELKFTYARPWEDDPKPNTKTVTVIVDK